MNKHPYDQLIVTVADKIKGYEDDNLGFGVFEKVDKDLGLGLLETPRVGKTTVIWDLVDR